jgi:hypothetical protein
VLALSGSSNEIFPGVKMNSHGGKIFGERVKGKQRVLANGVVLHACWCFVRIPVLQQTGTAPVALAFFHEKTLSPVKHNIGTPNLLLFTVG